MSPRLPPCAGVWSDAVPLWAQRSHATLLGGHTSAFPRAIPTAPVHHLHPHTRCSQHLGPPPPTSVSQGLEPGRLILVRPYVSAAAFSTRASAASSCGLEKTCVTGNTGCIRVRERKPQVHRGVGCGWAPGDTRVRQCSSMAGWRDGAGRTVATTRKLVQLTTALGRGENGNKRRESRSLIIWFGSLVRGAEGQDTVHETRTPEENTVEARGRAKGGWGQPLHSCIGWACSSGCLPACLPS